jgi:hypothetical protein
VIEIEGCFSFAAWVMMLSANLRGGLVWEVRCSKDGTRRKDEGIKRWCLLLPWPVKISSIFFNLPVVIYTLDPEFLLFRIKGRIDYEGLSSLFFNLTVVIYTLDPEFLLFRIKGRIDYEGLSSLCLRNGTCFIVNTLTIRSFAVT